jgi:hypothetical protein
MSVTVPDVGAGLLLFYFFLQLLESINNTPQKTKV